MRTNFAKIFLIVSIPLLWNSTGLGNHEPLPLKEGKGSTIIPSANLIEDPSRKMTPQDAYHAIEMAKTRKVNAFTSEYSEVPLWFTFHIINESTINGWCLAAQSAGLTQLRVFKVIKNENERVFVEQEVIAHRAATSWLDMEPGESAEFIATYRSIENLYVNFTVAPVNDVVKKELTETAWLGVASGIMLAVIVYNTFLFLSLRQKFHLYYIIFAVTNALMGLFAMNFPQSAWHFVYNNVSEWIPYFRCLGPLATLAFASVFLQTRTNHKMIHKAFLAYVVGLVVICIYSMSDKDVEVNGLLDPYFLLGILLLLYAGIHAYRKGFTPAKYYVIGLTAFLTGILIVILYPYFTSTPNVFVVTAHIWGQAIEMLLMSLALAAEIKILEKEKFRAVVAAETKSRLLRVISHDIRNPLAIIKGYGNMLSQRMPNEVNLQKILRSANVIEEITEVVQRSELEQKRNPKELVPVSISAVFDEISFLFHRSAFDKNIHLNFVVHPDDLKVLADEIILTNEILGNIVNNAIKFSFSGSSVEIKAFALGEKVRISIKDNGIGIPKALLPRIFDKESNSASRRGTSGELGAGFGLPIAYSYLQEFKGQIDVKSTSFEESDELRGTEFTITLRRAGPLAIVKQSQSKAIIPE